MQVDGLENLKCLEHLYLNHNRIKELDPGSFASLQTLRILHLGDNSLKNLVHLSGLISLESLDLTSNGLTPNRLGGFASIDFLSPLPKLTKLWLNNNPVSESPDWIPQSPLVSYRCGNIWTLNCWKAPLDIWIDLLMVAKQMSRQNQYRISVIGRLEHLEQLDGRPITQVHHQILSKNSILPIFVIVFDSIDKDFCGTVWIR